jgi:hypothetical protein
MIDENLKSSLNHIREKQLPDSIPSLETNVWRKIHLQENEENSLDWLGSLLFRSGFIMSTLALTILMGIFFGSFSSQLNANNKTSSAAEILGFDALTEKPGLPLFTHQPSPKKK